MTSARHRAIPPPPSRTPPERGGGWRVGSLVVTLGFGFVLGAAVDHGTHLGDPGPDTAASATRTPESAPETAPVPTPTPTPSNPAPADQAFYESLVTAGLSDEVGGAIDTAAQLRDAVCQKMTGRPDIHGAFNAQTLVVTSSGAWTPDTAWDFVRAAVTAACPDQVNHLP